MQAPFKHIVADQTLWLSPSRIIYWEDEQAVIISDLHFGKTGHFRKSGIAIPQSAFRNDMQRLFEQIQHFQPRKLIIVGDMFHSKANKELDFFLKWRNDHSHLEIILVKGNHDILQTDWYEQSCIQLTNPSLYIKEFCFVHDLAIFQNPEKAAGSVPTIPAVQKTKPEHYYFTGHIHPGILIRGLGKQSLRFPCFYFGEQYAILPAFGNFTGFSLIEPSSRENVFAIVENKIIQIQ
jgi:uncharacterized protein